MRTVAEFALEGAEAGVGLALRDDGGRHLFVLAGRKHRCPPGELFYAGLGGHQEQGEDWAACAQREAREELGTDVEIMSAFATWHIRRDGAVEHLEVVDRPRPFAFYEMVHPPGTARAGQLYRIVVYEARLVGVPAQLSPDEVQGVIALTTEQVMRGLERRPTLGELLDEGASLVAGGEGVDPQVRLYCLGTAAVLAHVLRLTAPAAAPESRSAAG